MKSNFLLYFSEGAIEFILLAEGEPADVVHVCSVAGETGCLN